jgi:hypothetical protein
LGPRPRGRTPSIFSTAVIYPVVKVHRRGGPTTGSMAPGRPSDPLVGGLLVERTDQGICWVLTRVDGSEDLPANRRSSWDGPGCLGLTRGIRFVLASGAAGLVGGGDEETRTPDPLLAKEMLCQLSYVPVTKSRREVVGAPGLEPGTSALSGPRSNQLSYAPWRPASPDGQAAWPHRNP